MKPAHPISLILCIVMATQAAAPAAPLVVPNLGGEDDIPDVLVDVSTAWSSSGVRPGELAHFAIVLDIAPRWHLYTDRAPEGQSTKIAVTDAPAFVGPVSFTFPPSELVDKEFNLAIYEGRVVVYGSFSPGAEATVGEHPIRLTLSWQACKEQSQCIPETVEVVTTLQIVDASTPVEPTNAALFANLEAAQELARLIPFDLFGRKFTIDPERQFVLLLGVAVLGGFLLNLTPCVLPLIPIKVMGLSRAAGNRGRCLLLGAIVSLGVIAFWMTLAGMIVSITGFKATNQLFQNTGFTIGIGVVIAVMAVSMMGVFTVRLPQAVYMINPSQDSIHGSFLFGVMTAVLSTPCTAPFMGTAAAWAATQSTGVTLAVFAAIGTGMALPYLVLAAFPSLTHRMPKAGPASELIKQVMGLLMLAAAAYFLGTGLAGALVTPPDPPTLLYWWVIALAIVAAGSWLAYRTLVLTRSPSKRAVFVTAGALLAAIGGLIVPRFTDRGPVHWTYYTPHRLDEAKDQDKVVVIDFTAQWCANCLALERTVLYTKDVAAALNRPDVAPIKVDITGKNPAGNDLLIAAGRRSIPLLVVLDRSGNEVFKGDWYTASQVIEAIEKAGGKRPDVTPTSASSQR